MKKYMIIAAAAVLALSACSKVQNYTMTEYEDLSLGFSTYSPRNITKAGSTYTETAALPTGTTTAPTRIGVYGYSTDANAHFLGTEKPEFITNGEVSFTGSCSSPTGATEQRYWPKDLSNLLTFYAYYPYGNTAIQDMPTASTNGLGSFHMTQTGDVTTMIDFMISNVQNDMYFWDGTNTSTNLYGRKSEDNGSTKGIVPLSLNHMMANVNFFFKTNLTDADITVKVKEASIAGVLSQGVFTPSYTVPSTAGAQGSTSFTTAEVATSAYGAAVVIPIGSVEQVNSVDTDKAYITLNTTAKINYADVDGTTTKNNFLFIPQTLTGNVKVTIKYDLTQGGSTTENTVVVPIMGSANDANNSIVKWEYNHKYNYNFTIGLHEIMFTSAALAWEDGGNGNITVL